MEVKIYSWGSSSNSQVLSLYLTISFRATLPPALQDWTAKNILCLQILPHQSLNPNNFVQTKFK